MKRNGLLYDTWLKGQLKNPRLKKAYAEQDLRARLAVRIAELRRERKVSQSELAKRLRTTQQVISEIETYKHANITLFTLQKIALALNTRLIIDLR